MLESTIQKAAFKYARSRGWWCAKVDTSKAGFPDAIFVGFGHVKFIELKRPKTKDNARGKLSAIQKLVIGKLLKGGANVYVTYDKQSILDLLDEWEANPLVNPDTVTLTDKFLGDI